MTMRNTTCCGMFELSILDAHNKWMGDVNYLSGKYVREEPEKQGFRLVKEVYSYGFKKITPNEGWHNKKPFVVFTDVDSIKNGSLLEDYIHTHKLGVTFTSNAKYNPNSGNKGLRVYIWEVDWPALKKHCVPPKKAAKAPRKAVQKAKPARARVVAARYW